MHGPGKETLLPVVGAAVAGNALVGRESLRWFRGLRHPASQLPMPGFYAVGGAYYLVMGVVVHRAARRGDRRSYRLAMAVLAGNELWNAAFFGRRSTRNGFLGVLAFLVPLGLLQASVAGDRTSALVLAPYTAYVLGYDVPWTHRLWRLNPS
ncbi:TspO/MBR family protein [Geodermatophilus sp. SYSU D00766]